MPEPEYMNKKQMTNIFEYVDYRFFLRDYFHFHKKHQRKFSYRSFAQQAGVSASLLKDILNGRQNLTIAAMLKYAQAMRLTEKEIAYFKALVQFNNSRYNEEKNACFGDMVQLRGRSAVKFLDVKQYEYFSQWYHAVVRELLVGGVADHDPAAMSAKIVPKVSPAKIRKSIALLNDLGLVFQNDDGTFSVTDKVISSEYEIQSVALKNYHREMLEKAKNALETFPSDKREFQGMTLSSSVETYGRIKERMRSFSDEILSMVANEKDRAEVIFQLNMHIFPFVQEKGK
jgi:uncharacterized protein (TIGR02147 family)